MDFAIGASRFLEAFPVSHLIRPVIDCLVIDWDWFCYSKRVIIPGTGDLTTACKDYRFHAVHNLKGVLTQAICLIAD